LKKIDVLIDCVIYYHILIYNINMAVQWADPLHKAVSANDYNGVVLSIASGSDANGYIEIDTARFYHLYNVCGNHYSSRNNCTRTTIKIIKYLISKGADINSSNADSKWTPLHFAANCGYDCYVKVLLDDGANVDAQDKYGKTALENAERGGKWHVVKCIREHIAREVPTKGVMCDG